MESTLALCTSKKMQDKKFNATLYDVNDREQILIWPNKLRSAWTFDWTAKKTNFNHCNYPHSWASKLRWLSSLILEAELAKKTSEKLLAEAVKLKSYVRQGVSNSYNVHRREKRMNAQLAEKYRLLCGITKKLKVARHKAAKKSSMKTAYHKKGCKRYRLHLLRNFALSALNWTKNELSSKRKFLSFMKWMLSCRSISMRCRRKKRVIKWIPTRVAITLMKGVHRTPLFSEDWHQ